VKGFSKKTVGKLTLLTGPGAGSFYFLFKERTTLGRGEENPITIFETSVSRVHCQIVRTGDKHFLTDLNAKNGTFLNGEQLRPNQHYEVEPGSYIHLGSAELLFSVEKIEPDPTDTVEMAKAAPAGAPGEAGLFSKGTFDEEITAEIPTEGIPRGKRTSSTLPFNLFSSRNLVAVYRILGAVGSINDRQYLMEKSIEIVTEVMRAERGFIALVDEAGGGIGSYAASLKKARGEVSRTDIAMPMMNRVLKEGVAVLCSGPPDELGVPAPQLVQEGIAVSALCAPLQARERIFGAIFVDAPAGVRDFVKEDIELLSAIGIHLGALMENIELSLRNQELFLGVIRTLVYIIEAKDKYTLGHSERVTGISLAVAGEIGLGPKEREALRVSALIHDIGKIVIPESILNKRGKLTEEEYLVVKKHPVVGYNFVEHLAGFDEVRNGILYHHERFDGGGYPKALAGEAIPLIARIIAAADAFDAMTSDRPYREGFSEEDAIQELLAHKGTQFDGQVIDAFIQAYVSGSIKLDRAKPSPISRDPFPEPEKS
jgi:HD-GYP domain-containing protein (c-di-GMP phosphodiesterase class II)